MSVCTKKIAEKLKFDFSLWAGDILSCKPRRLRIIAQDLGKRREQPKEQNCPQKQDYRDPEPGSNSVSPGIKTFLVKHRARLKSASEQEAGRGKQQTGLRTETCPLIALVCDASLSLPNDEIEGLRVTLKIFFGSHIVCTNVPQRQEFRNPSTIASLAMAPEVSVVIAESYPASRGAPVGTPPGLATDRPRGPSVGPDFSAQWGAETGRGQGEPGWE